VSFQITVLKVLAGHPDGSLSVEDLKRAVAILITSGADWTGRTKRLAARAPDLDIFSQSLVTCDAHRWRITEAGRVLLAAIDSPAAAVVDEAPQGAAAEPAMYSTSAPLPMSQVGRRQQRKTRRRRRAGRPAA
jgi:hypothetical protein